MCNVILVPDSVVGRFSVVEGLCMNLIFKKSIFLVLLIGSSASIFCDSVKAVVVDSGEDAKSAFERVKLLAKSENAEAQAQLADLYLAGKGVAKNVQKAFKYYKKAGQLNVLRAQLAVADGYYYGHDVAQSYKKSLKCNDPSYFLFLWNIYNKSCGLIK